ncbi:hypothetical protein ACFZB2_41010 [Streptomyces bobili]|uniref:hypothetical protein n=1 Tax=Streptomyces bobili TaxID=67280 RepID=UPI0036E49F14
MRDQVLPRNHETPGHSHNLESRSNPERFTVPPRVRQFTLLRTEDSDGSPVRYETTLPTGTTITPWVNGHQRHYTLTDGQLADGTFAAEPLDHL